MFPTNFELTSDMLVTFAGVISSLLFSYLPGLRTWWAKIEPDKQRLGMAGLMFLIAAAVVGGSCVGIFQTNVTCNQAGILQVFWLWVMALIGNQSTFMISPKTKDVRNAKLNASLERLSLR